MPTLARLLVLLPLLGMGLIGCATAPSTRPTSSYAPAAHAERNPLRAQDLTRRAAEIIHDDPECAEELLREALAADLFHGPAHNNLGVIHLDRGQLYEAASEFEWARKLMPGHPDPRVNLALTLERAGRIDGALATYSSALEVHRHDLAAMQGLARLQILTDRTDDRTERFLQEIVMRADDPAWRDWAEHALRRLEFRSGRTH